MDVNWTAQVWDLPAGFMLDWKKFRSPSSRVITGLVPEDLGGPKLLQDSCELEFPSAKKQNQYSVYTSSLSPKLGSKVDVLKGD